VLTVGVLNLPRRIGAASASGLAPLQPRIDSEVISPIAMAGRNAGIGVVPGRRPIFGQMTPGIELAERIEHAQILVIIRARDICETAMASRSPPSRATPAGSVCVPARVTRLPGPAPGACFALGKVMAPGIGGLQ
jgi:hypothetical protein